MIDAITRIDEDQPDIVGRHICSHCNAFSAATCGSSGHLAAGLSAATARLGAALAVIHVMRAALLRTPAADVRAQFADLFDVRAVAGDRIGAQAADCRTLDATGQAGILAVIADHLRETSAACGGAGIAGL